MMDKAILVLLVISSILFFLSFFKKDRTKQLEKQLEDLSMTYMQEMYQLKKKMRLLEDELLFSHEQSPFKGRTTSQKKLFDEVYTYYTRGEEIETIAKKTGLTPNEVEHFLLPYLRQEGEVEAR